MIAAVEPKTNKAKETRNKIVRAAKEVFARKGLNKSTVHDIAKKAKMGYGTFYLYFKDKKDVFAALVAQIEDDLYSAKKSEVDLSKDYPRGRHSYRALRQDLKAILESFREHATVLEASKELSILDANFRADYQKMRERLIHRTEEILRKSEMQNVDLHIAAIAITGMIEAVALEMVNKGFDFDRVLPTVTKIYFKAVS